MGSIEETKKDLGMGLDRWLEKAKKDGIIRDEPTKKEETIKEGEKVGSSPTESDELEKLMAIQPLTKEQKAHIYRLMVETKGKGSKIYDTLVDKFMKAFPEVNQWLKDRSKGSQKNYGLYLLRFLQWAKMTPKQFIDLCHSYEERCTAAKLLFRFESEASSPVVKQSIRKACKSFYKFHTWEDLPLDGRGAHRIVGAGRPIRTKIEWGDTDEAKDKVYTMLDVTHDDDLRMIMEIIFKSGVRENTVCRLNPKHFIKSVYDAINPDTNEPFRIWAFKVTDELDTKLREAKIEYYYAFLDTEAVENLKQYIEKHNIKDDDLLFISEWGNPFTPLNIEKRIKLSYRLAGLPEKKGTPHQLRMIFQKCVTNCGEIKDKDFKEFIMGHMLEGSREYYQQRDVKELAREYVKIDFRRSIESLKQRFVEEQRKKLEQEAKIARLKTTVESAGLKVPEEPSTWKAPSFEEVPSSLETSPPIVKAPPPKPPTPIVSPAQGQKEAIHKMQERINEKIKEEQKKPIEVPLGPPPKPGQCLRGQDFTQEKDDEYCHTICARGYSTQYRACQEAKSESPELFL